MCDPVTKEVLRLDTPHQLYGGTHAIGGTTELWLNITYNYSKHYSSVIDEEQGIRKIYGMRPGQRVFLFSRRQ